MKKYIVILLSLLVILSPIVVKADNLTPKVDPDKKVYDLADLLTDDEEAKLYDLAMEFYEETNMDMVLVIIDDNPYGSTDHDIELYGMDFYDYNNFGVGSSRDGVLFLVDMDNRAPAVVATGQAILVYDDERKDTILENAYSYLKSGSYYSAFKSYVNDALYYYEKGIPESNKYFCVDEEGEYYKCKEEPKEVNWVWSSVIAFLGSVIPIFVHTRKYRGIKLAVNANSYLKDVQINNSTDQFLTTFTSRVRRSTDNGSSGHGGGFSGGGSSISHGSSGMSHSSSVGRHF